MKIAKIALSAIMASCFALGAGNNSDCVCFKLEGEMGKELKALIEKYHGELAQAQTKAKNVEETSNKFSIFTVEEKKAITAQDRIEAGKRIYTLGCASCHGQKGETKASAGSMAIKDMSKEDFMEAIKGYRNGDYGGSAKYSMIPYANTVTADELNNIYEYLIKLNIVQK